MIFNLDNKFWQWFVLLALAFIWGSSFILMKKGLLVYDHNEVAAMRLVFASLALVPFALAKIKSIPKNKWKWLIAVGIFGNGIPAFLFTKAQTELSSSLTGMLNSLTTIFALVLGVIIFNQKTVKSQVIGAIIGFFGAIGLILSDGANIIHGNLYYTVYVVLACVCYALSVNIIKTHLKEIGSVTITSVALFALCPFVIAYALSTNYIETTLSNPDALLANGYIFVLGVLGTSICVILFNMLIKKVSTLFATSVTYLIPVFAIFWGIFDGEILSVFHILSLVVILVGIYFINKF